MSITKAVIAVAGYGTRLLPATKAVPKEMLPVVDRPCIQHLVEEAARSGISDVILVTRPGSEAIDQHFATSAALEAHLVEQQKDELLEVVRGVASLANVISVIQSADLPYGNGSPILAAKAHLTPGEPFVYMFGDDLVLSDVPAVKQLVDAYTAHTPAAVVAVQEVPDEMTSAYGIVAPKPGTDPMEMDSIIEKPSPAEAPSRLAQFGRFVLSYKVVEILEQTAVGKGNELWLTDAIARLCREDRVLVQKVEGTWYTTGDHYQLLVANIEYALADPEIRSRLAPYLKRKAAEL
ncbi:MAG: NTP transferase domain-containing protein [Deltaproteobacteria bacterium]|nr:NTP transferase domain-containing protein [Deltaproteobacteria bacterium]